MAETIAIGADHAAFAVKQRLIEFLQSKGYKVKDFGTDSMDRCDYPDIAHALSKAVVQGKYKRGVLLCGTGLGMSYVANRYEGIRAALCWSREVAKMAREHNDSNILVMAGRHATIDPVEDILQVWLNTDYPAEERNVRRIRMIEKSC